MTEHGDKDQQSAERSAEPLSRLGQDRIVGIVILLVGGFLFYETFNFRVVAWDPLGLAFWPRIVLGIMGVLAVYLIVRNSVDAGPFQPLQARAFVLLAGLSLYVLLLPRLGYLIATPIMLFCFHVALGGTQPKRLVEAAIFAVVATGIVDWVFESLLFVQFPQGLMEPPI